MLRCVSLVLAIAFCATGASAQDTSPATQVAPEATRARVRADMRGVWKVTELASRAPGAEWEVRATPYLSQYIFTAKHQHKLLIQFLRRLRPST